jgi:hypothetical protein
MPVHFIGLLRNVFIEIRECEEGAGSSTDEIGAPRTRDRDEADRLPVVFEQIELGARLEGDTTGLDFENDARRIARRERWRTLEEPDPEQAVLADPSRERPVRTIPRQDGRAPPTGLAREQ